jgi:carboxymethylenebutenolidase
VRVVQTRDVRLDTPEGSMRAYEARPDGEARGAVIVIQEAFGVNAHIEDVTRRVADAGYLGLAMELFHRAGGGTAEYGDFEKVIELFSGLDSDEKILADVDAGIAHLRGEGFALEQIGLVGFCFGGRVSFLVALNRPIGASVGFYGGGIASKGRLGTFPALIDEAPSLQVPWLGLFGDLDQGIPVDDVERLRSALESAPADTEIMRYADAGHGFHCDVRDAYEPEAARDAWQRALAWFDKHI